MLIPGYRPCTSAWKRRTPMAAVWHGRLRERPAPRQSTICTPKTTGLTQVGLARALPSTGTTDHSPASVFRPGSVVSSSPCVASANSILIGAHFERVDMSVGCTGSTGIPCDDTGIGGHIHQFHRNRIMLRE